jgi:hypothetical protein
MRDGITPSSDSGDLSSNEDLSVAALELLVLGKIAGEKAC